MEALAALEREKDTRREEIIHIVSPIKPALIHLAKSVFDSFKRNTIQTAEGPFYTAELNYQVIGGDAIALITGKYIKTPDIDIEVAPIINAEGSPVGFYRRIGSCSEEVSLPYVKYYRTRRQQDESGEIKTIILSCEVYEVHPAYMLYMVSVRNALQVHFTQMFQDPLLQGFNSICQPVDPSLDPETKHESPLSFDVGNFHFSFIINPQFISKIQLSVSINGKAEHILELIFHKSKHSHFFPVIKPLEPVEIQGILVTNPFDLLEQNIEAFVSRIYKKKQVEQDFLNRRAEHTDVIYINTKLYNTLDRIASILEILGEDGRVKAAIKYLLHNSSGANPFVIARLCDMIHTGEKDIQAILDEMCSAAKATAKPTANAKPTATKDSTPKKANGTLTLTIPAPALSLTVKGKSKKPVQVSEEPWETVSSSLTTRATPKAVLPQSGLPYFGEYEDNSAPEPIKPSAPPVPIKLNEYTKPPLKEEDFDTLLKSHRAIVGGDLLPIDYYLIKEPLAMLKSFDSRPTEKITLKNKYTLFSILEFIANIGTDFIFVYTLPSIHTGLYYHQTTYEENIVYEEPSLHHIFKLYELYIRLKNLPGEVNLKLQRKGIREKESFKKEQIRLIYNTILIIIGQIQLRTILPEGDLSPFYETFTVEFVKKGHSDDIIPQIIESILLLESKMLFHLTQKYRLAEIFKIPTVAGMLAHIRKPEDFYFKFNTLRAAFLNRQIEHKKETHSGHVYIFYPYNTLVGDENDLTTRGAYEKLFYDAIHESKFTRQPFPNPAFTNMNKLLHLDIYDKATTNQFCIEYNSNMFHVMIDIFNDMMDVIEGGTVTTDEYVATLIQKTLLLKDKDGKKIVMKRPENLPELLKIVFDGTKDILLNDTQPISVSGDKQMSAPVLQTLFINIYQDMENDMKIKNLKFLLSKIELIAHHNMGMSDILDRHTEFVRSLLQEEKAKLELGERIEPGIIQALQDQFNHAIKIDDYMTLIDTPNTAPIDIAFLPRPKFWKLDSVPTPLGPGAGAGAGGGGGSKPPPQVNNLDRKTRRKRKRKAKRKTRSHNI